MTVCSTHRGDGPQCSRRTRRAPAPLVLVTDGIDTASLHSGEDAATAAARFDLPVYVIGVGRLAGASPDANPRDTQAFSVAELARRTGGFSGDGTSAAQLSALTQSILDELRHQYVVAFSAGSEPGWHQLQVRVKRGKVECEIAGWLSGALSVGSCGS